MFCKNCGKSISDEAKFCNGCGAKTETAQAAANTAPQPSAYMPPAQAAPVPQTYAPPHPYAPPSAPASYSPQPGREPLRVIQYIGMFLLMSIPLVGIILLFVWSFGGSVNLNKKNFARAMLILSAIGLILSIIFGAALMSIIGELLGNMGGYY